MKLGRIVPVLLLLTISGTARADRVDDFLDNPGPDLLKRDTNDRRDPLDRVLSGDRNFPIEIEGAIRRGERYIAGQRQVITTIKNEPPNNGPIHYPPYVWNDHKSYEKIATNTCNRSLLDEEHIALQPADDLCSRIFHSPCYSSLSERNREKIDRCPPVYDEQVSKGWRIAQAEERIARMQDKIDRARKLLPGSQAIDADTRTAKTVGANDDGAPLRRPGSFPARIRGIDSP